MDTQGRRTFLHLVLVLLVTGGIRTAWSHRGGGPGALPGSPVSTDVLADSASRVAEAEARRAAPLAPGERIDVNRAPEAELDRLPGVGPGTARALVEARDTLPFSSLDDLLRVRGIGPRTLDRLAPHLEMGALPRTGRGVTLAGAGTLPGRGDPARVDVNRATAEALQALPGVGPVLARRIVDYRDGGGRFRVPEDLLPVPGIGPVLLEKLRPHLRF